MKGSKMMKLKIVNSDVFRYIDHAGKYRVTISHNGGSDEAMLHGISIHSPTEKVAESKAIKALKTKGAIEYIIDLTKYSKELKPALHIELELSGGTDIEGRVRIFPLLD